MKSPIHCKKPMKLRNVMQSLMTGAGELAYEYFWQCDKCGETKMTKVKK